MSLEQNFIDAYVKQYMASVEREHDENLKQGYEDGYDRKEEEEYATAVANAQLKRLQTADDAVLNRDLLIRTSRYIKNHPENFNMDFWVLNESLEDSDEDDAEDFVDHETEDIKCGTTMCFAGTAVFLNLEKDEPLTNSIEFSTRAGEELGLTKSQRNTLFLLPNDLDTVFAAVSVIMDEDVRTLI